MFTLRLAQQVDFKLLRSPNLNLNFASEMASKKNKKVPKTVAKDKPVPEITMPDIEESIPPRWEPANWKEILQNIRAMRAKSKAPVDTMGCHKCADGDKDEKTQRFHKLVALMLSSQTRDELTYEIMQRLTSMGLTPASVVAMDVDKLQNLLKPVSFYKNKAKYMKQTAQILIDKYDSDIPNNIKELVALPGIGPKMAHICMATAWNETTGIGVDVHVHRISNRLQWVQKETKEPEKTRLALEEWLPRELWQEVNHLLVGFGQTICTPLRPHCHECLNREICPSAGKGGRAAAAGRKKAALPIENNESDKESVPTVIKKAKFQRKKMHI